MKYIKVRVKENGRTIFERFANTNDIYEFLRDGMTIEMIEPSETDENMLSIAKGVKSGFCKYSTVIMLMDSMLECNLIDFRLYEYANEIMKGE